MTDYKEVPVTVALAIAENYDKSMVVVICYDQAHNKTHTTTYGVSAVDKENAKLAGRKCTEALHGGTLKDESIHSDFHTNYDAARYQESLELLQKVLDHKIAPEAFRTRANKLLDDAFAAQKPIQEKTDEPRNPEQSKDQ